MPVNAIPTEHIVDAHKLDADGALDLFELTPSSGSGTIRFKDGNDFTWRGNLYTGVPLAFSGDEISSERSSLPRLVIGQENVDLSIFKPLIFDGSLDGAIVTRIHILLDNLINNRLIREVFLYRVKRLENYNVVQVTMQLASLSDSLGFAMPYRGYYPPAFPAVQI